MNWQKRWFHCNVTTKVCKVWRWLHFNVISITPSHVNEKDKTDWGTGTSFCLHVFWNVLERSLIRRVHLIIAFLQYEMKFETFSDIISVPYDPQRKLVLSRSATPRRRSSLGPHTEVTHAVVHVCDKSPQISYITCVMKAHDNEPNLALIFNLSYSFGVFILNRFWLLILCIYFSSM